MLSIGRKMTLDDDLERLKRTLAEKNVHTYLIFVETRMISIFAADSMSVDYLRSIFFYFCEFWPFKVIQGH